MCQRDVTAHPELIYGSVAHSLIMYNKIVNRNIKRLFKDAWHRELPYCGNGIGIKNLFEMTMFVGYTKEFYSAVPYKLDSMLVDNSFIKNVQYGWRDMLLAAIDYSCANSNVKKAIQENWKGNCSIGRIVQRKPLYSVPMKRPEERIVDCNIDGYDFFWLRSSNGYEIAGKKLKNCLASWGVDNSPVVCVKKMNNMLQQLRFRTG